MNKNKYTVDEFVQAYTKCSSDNIKRNMITKIVSKHYSPLLEKVSIARETVKKSMVNENDYYVKSSIALYLNYVMSILLIYCPDLTLNKKNNFKDYDLLKQNNILELILQEIGEDLEEYHVVYNMETDDFINNQTNPYKYVNNQITRVTTILGEICDSSLKGLNENLKNIDKNKLDKIIKSLI